jgi:DNA polymerase I-like protein with 3'-5' exonuclease and polymerase domains
MQILVNYDPKEKQQLPIVAGILKRHGISAKASSESFGISELLNAAKKTGSQGILLCNEGTLKNCVQVPVKTQATLSTFRGSRLNFSIPAIVCAPLDQIHTLQYGNFLLDNDIKKFKHLSRPPIQLKFKVCETVDDFLYAVGALNQCIFISADIETDGHSRITCIAFTGVLPNLNTTTFVIPFIDFGMDHWPTEKQYGFAIQMMRDICANDVPKMFYNGNYDCQYLIKYHAEPNNWVLDTMGLLHAQYAELEKNLAFAASLHCFDYYYWKLEDSLSKKNKEIRGYWGYCAKDSWYPARIFINMIQEDYPSYAVSNYQRLFKLCYPCIYCAFEGIKISEPARLEARQTSEDELSKRSIALKTMAANPNFNPNSPKQVATFLYDIIGAKPVPIKNKQTGKYETKKSTDKKVLQNKIATQHPLLTRIIEDIISYREEQKAISTYFDFLKYKMPDSSCRLLYSMSPFTTDTGRFSSKQSNFRKMDYEEGKPISYGTQIQNQPTDGSTKSFLIADEGYEMAEADNNKSEARCVALLSGCRKMQTAIEYTERDFYKSLGPLFFGIPYEKVSKELRNSALKHIVHQANYLGGWEVFINRIGIKKVYEIGAMLEKQVVDVKAFVNWLIARYHIAFPEVQDHWKEIRREVLRTHKLVSVLGYTRHFFGNIIEDHSVLRAAVAHEPQNLSVSILNKGFWKIYRDIVLTEHGAFRLKAQIHDAVMFQYLTERREEFKISVLRCMDNPTNVRGQVLTIPVDYKYGQSWKQIKDQ